MCKTFSPKAPRPRPGNLHLNAHGYYLRLDESLPELDVLIIQAVTIGQYPVLGLRRRVPPAPPPLSERGRVMATATNQQARLAALPVAGFFVRKEVAESQQSNGLGY